MSEIEKYLRELGATPEQSPEQCPEQERLGHSYNYAGLRVEITAYEDDTFPDIGTPRHTIAVHGDPVSAEDFLTEYRFRFMSAGG